MIIFTNAFDTSTEILLSSKLCKLICHTTQDQFISYLGGSRCDVWDTGCVQPWVILSCDLFKLVWSQPSTYLMYFQNLYTSKIFILNNLNCQFCSTMDALRLNPITQPYFVFVFWWAVWKKDRRKTALLCLHWPDCSLHPNPTGFYTGCCLQQLEVLGTPQPWRATGLPIDPGASGGAHSCWTNSGWLSSPLPGK